MARSKLSKSARIRQYQADHPEAGPTEVAKALSKYGITKGLVANVKAREKAKAQPKRKAVKKKSTTKAKSGASVTTSFDSVVAAAELIKACGGVEHAKRAIDAAANAAQVLR